MNHATPDLDEAVRLLEDGKGPVIVEKDGKPIGALVSLEELAALREMEDRIDLDAARRALDEPGDDIPWETIKAKHGL